VIFFSLSHPLIHRLVQGVHRMSLPKRMDSDCTGLESSAPLASWERWGLKLFFVLLLGFGALVVYRSAFLRQRLGDFRVFAQAAWAVRAGTDFYDLQVDGRWHYCYPPFLAIVLRPLADPPAGVD